MSWKSTVVLLVLACLGVALFFLAPTLAHWFHWTDEPVDETGAGTLAVLSDNITADALTEIEVGEGYKQFLLKRQGDQWLSKWDWPTRSAEVGKLVDTLTSLRSRFAPQPIDERHPLADFGLDKPSLIVRVTAGDKSYRLAFGTGKLKDEANPFSAPTFLRLDDRDEVVRLAPGLLTTLDRPKEYYQQRRLFPVERVKKTDRPSDLVDVAQATAVAISNSSSTSSAANDSYALIKAQDEWQLDLSLTAVNADKPYRDRVLQGKEQPILIAVGDVWVEQFIETLDRDGRLAVAQMLTLQSGGLLPWFGAGGNWDKFKDDLKETRSLFGFEDPQGQAITVTRPNGKTIELVIGAQAPIPEGTPASALAKAEFRYARLKPTDEKKDQKHYGLVLVIDYGKLRDSVFVKYSTLRDPSVVTFQPGDATQVALERDKDKLVFEKEAKPPHWVMKVFDRSADNNQWSSTASLQSDVEDIKLDDLLRELAALKAEKDEDIVYQDDPKYGLQAGALRVHVRVEEDDKSGVASESKPKKKREFTVVLAAKEPEAGKYYAKLDGFPRINRVKSTILPHAERAAADFRKRRLFDWASSDLKSVTVNLKDEKISLARVEQEWNLVSPVPGLADAVKAGQLASDVAGLQVIDYLKSDPGEKYGLDPAAVTVEGIAEKDGKGQPFKLLIGNERPGKPEFFARLDGHDDVFSINKTFVESLKQSSLAYRTLAFKKLKPGQVQEVRVQRQNEKEFVLRPTGRGWEIREPFQATALDTLAQPIADALVRLKAERYLTHKASAEELDKYGLETPYLRVTMVPSAPSGSGLSSGASSGSASGSGSTKPPVLLVGGVEDKEKSTRYAKFADDDAVFVLAKDPVAAVDIKALALLDPRVLELSPDAMLTGFQSNSGGKEFTLATKDDKWQVVESPAGTFTPDPSVVNQLRFIVKQFAVKEFKEYGADIDWTKYELKAPKITTEISFNKEGAKPQRIAFGAAVPDGAGAYYARVNDLPAVIVLDARTSTTLRQGYLDFVNHQVFQDLKPDKVTKVQIQQGDRSLVLEKKDASWQIVASAPAPADEETIQNVLDQLASLRAKRVLAFPVKEWRDYSPDAPAAVVKLSGDKEIELQIGKVIDEATGDRAAMVTGSNTVVVIGGDLARIFLSGPVYFRDHLVARIKDDVDRVILEAGDKKTTFVRVDGTWKRKTEGDDAEADSDELEQFVSNLSKLRADELAADKPADLKFYGLDAPPIRWRLQAGDKDVMVLAVGKVAPEKEQDGVKQLRHFARVDQGDLVFILDEKTTLRALGRFRVRRIWPDLTAEQITGLTYRYGKDTFSLTKIGQNWMCTDPAVQVDNKRVEETLQALANLKAERFIAEKATDLQPFGLKEPMLILEIQTPKRKLELHFSKPDAITGKYRARVGGTAVPDVFSLSFLDALPIVKQARNFGKAPQGFPPGGEP